MNRSRAAFASFFVVAAVTACGGSNPGDPDGNTNPADAPLADAAPTPDAGPLPRLFYPVDMANDPLALLALQKMGAEVDGAETRCDGCHAMTNAQIRQWRSYASNMNICASDESLMSQSAARGTLSCVQSLTPTGELDARALGFYAAAGTLPWFAKLFDVAYGPDSPEYASFVDEVAMPPHGTNALTQSEFDVVAEWFTRGLPRLEFYLPAIGTGDCDPTITPELTNRITNLAFTGWRAQNLASSISMYGCAGATSALDCMADQPAAPDRSYSNTWDVAPYTLRILAELPDYNSSFWTRTSADGRFVAHGGGDGAGGSTIIDLTDDSHIGVDAAYDPTFFPDNSGFIFQGAGNNTCAQSILLGHPTSISMDGSPQCSDINIGLYQHVGRAVGSDYFAISGNFVTDDGGVGQDPFAFFPANDSADIMPMIFNGTAYQPKTSTSVALHNEGDAVISPSMRLMITRKGDADGKQTAFVVRAVNAIPSGNSYNVTIPEIGSYCMSGGKPAFSYDERWITFHHVVSPTSDADAIDLGFADASDPGYAQYAASGTSNIYLLDLLTGQRRRITMMKPGQFAYFPHFRSDGWIYFLERGGSRETIVASDAALKIEAEE
jgi:hypothetical protein